jgi:hypothetical protein
VLGRRRLLPALLATVTLTGAACGLAPAANADGGPQIVAYDVPSTVQADVPATFDVTLTDDASVIGPVSWSFGDGSQPTSGAQTSHAWGSPGSYTVTVSATDGLGIPVSESFVVNVEAAPLTTPATAPAAAPAALRFGATQARRRWTPRHGTVFTLLLSQRADVTITFARRGKGALAISAHPLGMLSTDVAAGQHRIVFHGVLSAHRRLAPGNYLATLIAGTGGVSAAPIALEFTVTRNHMNPRSRRDARRLRQRDR